MESKFVYVFITLKIFQTMVFEYIAFVGIWHFV